MELTTWNLPVLALRGLTVFPHMTLTFDVERPISIAALERAMEADQDIFLVTQREIGVNAPEEKDLYTIGTVSHITQILRLGQSSVRVMVEGRQRAHLRRLWQTEPFLQANVEAIPEEPSSEAMRKSPRTEALLRQTYALFGEYAEQASGVPEEVVATVMDSRDPGFLADYIAQNIALRYTDKQEILEEFSPFARLRKLNGFLVRENNVLGFEHEMESKVRDQLVRTQRDQILRTQIRVLQNELGETDDGDEDEIESYRQEILALELPEETEQHLLKEVNKLAKQPFGSAEGAVIRNYLDVCLEMPWNTTTKERVSVDAARRVLEKDHFGLEKVKERILETIAVRQMNPDVKGQILCLVGPPGVGKPSIAISVAKALNRKLARLSLGGVRDEADIRGHRKTYIGSMPGRIIEAISRSGSMNPLLLLDEIDKLGNDYRGDPASALLEVLDSEQNSTFRDHFLEIPVDLSKIMFITTANTTDTIPRPLLDRMEVIELTSYTDEEKLQIAKRHLFPKQLAEHGLKKSAVRISDDVYRAVIRDYTRESGVRLLERRLAAICRKADMRLLEGTVKRITVTEEELPKFLDCQPYPPGGGGQRHGRLRQAGAHRQPGRRDEGVCSSGSQLPAEPGGGAGDSGGLLQDEGHPRPLPRGRSAQGRPLRRHRRHHCHALGPDGPEDQGGHCHDRRSHAAGPGAAHRRIEGEDHGRPPQRHHHGADSQGQRPGSGGDRPDRPGCPAVRAGGNGGPGVRRRSVPRAGSHPGRGGGPCGGLRPGGA